MPQHIYDVTINGQSYEVGSDAPLTDAQAYQYAQSQHQGPAPVDASETGDYGTAFAGSLADTATRTGAGIVRGALAPMLHPIDTAKGIYDAADALGPYALPGTIPRTPERDAKAQALLGGLKTIASGDPDAGGEAIGGLLSGKLMSGAPRVLGSIRGAAIPAAAGVGSAMEATGGALGKVSPWVRYSIGHAVTGEPIGGAATVGLPNALQAGGSKLRMAAGAAADSRAGILRGGDMYATDALHGAPDQPLSLRYMGRPPAAADDLASAPDPAAPAAPAPTAAAPVRDTSPLAEAERARAWADRPEQVKSRAENVDWLRGLSDRLRAADAANGGAPPPPAARPANPVAPEPPVAAKPPAAPPPVATTPRPPTIDPADFEAAAAVKTAEPANLATPPPVDEGLYQNPKSKQWHAQGKKGEPRLDSASTKDELSGRIQTAQQSGPGFAEPVDPATTVPTSELPPGESSGLLKRLLTERQGGGVSLNVGQLRTPPEGIQQQLEASMKARTPAVPEAPKPDPRPGFDKAKRAHDGAVAQERFTAGQKAAASKGLESHTLGDPVSPEKAQAYYDAFGSEKGAEALGLKRAEFKGMVKGSSELPPHVKEMVDAKFRTGTPAEVDDYMKNAQANIKAYAEKTHGYGEAARAGRLGSLGNFLDSK